MTEHLDLDALADLLAGEGTGEQQAHVDACPSCRARLAELETAQAPVSAALQALADPPVPGHLAGRLDAALAQEHQARPGRSAAAAADVTPLPDRATHRSRWLPVAGAAAAAAVVATGGLLLARHDSGGTGSGATTATAPGYQVSGTGTDYAPNGTALRAALPALLGGRATGAAEAAAPTASGAKADSLAPRKSTLSGADPLARLRTSAGLASCLASLTDPGDPSDTGVPLALDYARFEGKPALVVVRPSSKADKVEVFVVGARCAQADADLLFFTRLPKP